MMLLKDPSIELLDGGTKVGLVFDKKDAREIVNAVSLLKPGIEYDVTIKKHGSRSINANNYHWTLCGQIARVLKTSKIAIHNQLLIRYGYDWLDAAGDRSYILMKDDDSYMDNETMHFRPTSHTEDRNGVTYRWYVLIKPSHLYNSTEMSNLIDGTVSEAKELGIDTRTPDEIARIKASWKGVSDEGN